MHAHDILCNGCLIRGFPTSCEVVGAWSSVQGESNCHVHALLMGPTGLDFLHTYAVHRTSHDGPILRIKFQLGTCAQKCMNVQLTGF